MRERETESVGERKNLYFCILIQQELPVLQYKEFVLKLVPRKQFAGAVFKLELLSFREILLPF